MSGAARSEGIWVEFQPMSPEEMERAMQFLLQHQAQFAADFEKLSIKTDLIADGLVGLTGLVGRAVEGLAAAQQVTDRQLKDVESNLDVVIKMFDRHLREDHGYGPQT